MNKYLILILGILVLQSCDDGDVIVSDFNFDEESSLNVCNLGNNKRILHIVTESNEAISLTFQKNIIENITDVLNPGTFSVPITNSNLINYRRLDDFINSNDYFCQDLPPSEPNITEEFQSTSGGSVEFTITRVSGENVDTDGDGIPDNEERQVDENGIFFGSVFDLDTDNDGIPNFLDIDDDNDNIPTSIERLENLEFNRVINENGIIDTDEDGVPNYLDPDDDGDGVITRYEDLNAIEQGSASNPVLNPENSFNANGIPHYLDATSTESLTIDFFRDNIVSRKFEIIVVFNDVTLENTSTGRTIRLDSQGFGFFPFNTQNEKINFRN